MSTIGGITLFGGWMAGPGVGWQLEQRGLEVRFLQDAENY